MLVHSSGEDRGLTSEGSGRLFVWGAPSLPVCVHSGCIVGSIGLNDAGAEDVPRWEIETGVPRLRVTWCPWDGVVGVAVLGVLVQALEGIDGTGWPSWRDVWGSPGLGELLRDMPMRSRIRPLGSRFAAAMLIVHVRVWSACSR